MLRFTLMEVAHGLPYLLLTLGGILLWKRHASPPTTMITVGFSAALVSELVGLLQDFELQAAVSTYQGSTTFIVTHPHNVARLIHGAGLLGLLAASLGLVWYARALPSPNNRWRGP